MRFNDGKRIREPAGFLGQQTHSTDKEAEVPLGTVLCYGPSPSPDPVGRPPTPGRAQTPSHTFRAAPAVLAYLEIGGKRRVKVSIY